MNEFPVPKFHFQVAWGGTKMGFSEVSGLDAEPEVFDHRDVNRSESAVFKMPGRQKYGNITFKRGVLQADNDFYKWLIKNQLENIDRQNIFIHLLDESNQPVMTWKIWNARPVKIQSTDLKANGAEIAIEILELVYEGISIEKT